MGENAFKIHWSVFICFSISFIFVCDNSFMGQRYIHIWLQVTYDKLSVLFHSKPRIDRPFHAPFFFLFSGGGGSFFYGHGNVSILNTLTDIFFNLSRSMWLILSESDPFKLTIPRQGPSFSTIQCNPWVFNGSRTESLRIVVRTKYHNKRHWSPPFVLLINLQQSTAKMLRLVYT